MSGKVMIVGTGNVGASIAFALLNQRTPVSELVLTDLDTADAEGEAMDLNDALAVAPSWLKIRAASATSGSSSPSNNQHSNNNDNNYREAKDCDIIVLTAGANQKPGESRTDLLQKNAEITRDIVTKIMQSGFDGIFIVVANPMDTLSYLTWQCSGLPCERVIGSGTILDSARLRYKLAQRLNVHPKSIHAYQVGEHGDSEFTLWSSANVGGESLERLISKSERERISEAVKNEAYEIIQRKGATHYGIGVCTVQLINCILNDERRVMPISSYDDCTDVYSGFPCVVGRQGIIKRLELRLTEAEGIKMQQSVNILRKTLAGVKAPIAEKEKK